MIFIFSILTQFAFFFKEVKIQTMFSLLLANGMMMQLSN